LECPRDGLGVAANREIAAAGNRNPIVHPVIILRGDKSKMADPEPRIELYVKKQKKKKKKKKYDHENSLTDFNEIFQNIVP
jgi:hypothetical protein